MKGHTPVPAVVQGRDGVEPETEAVEVLMLLVMTLEAGHHFIKRPGKLKQTLTLPPLTHPDSTSNAALVPKPLSQLAHTPQIIFYSLFFDDKVLFTPWMSEQCQVELCLQLDRNCFTDYHRSQKTPRK